MYRAKPQSYIPYDHARRAQRGAEYEIKLWMKNNQYANSKRNKEFFAARPDRLRLMGER